MIYHFEIHPKSSSSHKTPQLIVAKFKIIVEDFSMEKGAPKSTFISPSLPAYHPPLFIVLNQNSRSHLTSYMPTDRCFINQISNHPYCIRADLSSR